MRSHIFAVLLVLSSVVPVFPETIVRNDAEKTKNFNVKTTFAELICAPKDPTDIVGNQLNVMLDTSFNNFPTDLEKEQNAAIELNKASDSYKIVNLKTGEKIDLDLASNLNELQPQNQDSPDTESLKNVLNFPVKDTLLVRRAGKSMLGDEGLGLISNNRILADGEVKISTTLTKITLSSSSCTSAPAKLPKPSTEKVESKKFSDYFAKPETNDTAKLTLKFSIDGTKGTRRYFSNDIDFRPFRVHRLGFGGGYNLIPFYFKLNYSGDPKSPVDKMEFGAKIIRERMFNDDGDRAAKWEPHKQYAVGWTTTFTPRIETDWRFKEVNLVGELRSGVPFNINQGRSRALRLTPFIGFEGGLKLKSKAPQKENIIARPFFGGELFFSPYRTDEQTPVVFEANYIRRFFLKPELAYVINAAGKEVPGTMTRLPRDYANAKITFNYNGIISPFIEYTYGRQPTKYILVNSRYRAGLQLSFDWAAK